MGPQIEMPTGATYPHLQGKCIVPHCQSGYSLTSR
jgi:hypothetical protein